MDLHGFRRGALTWGKVVSSVFLYVIGFLGEFALPPLKIAFALRQLLHPGSMGRVGGRGWVIEGVCVERVGGAERVLGIAGWGAD